MRMLLILALLGSSSAAQVSSSSNLGCTVVAGRGMSCNGIGTPETKEELERKLPKLSTTHYTLEPGGVLEFQNSTSDCLLIGIDGGDLVNDRAPFRHVSLSRDEVTLLPKELPFRLRNDSAKDVEFRMIEIRR
jgi:hypothetical protein